jgi:hypothetical protein
MQPLKWQQSQATSARIFARESGQKSHATCLVVSACEVACLVTSVINLSQGKIIFPRSIYLEQWGCYQINR